MRFYEHKSELDREADKLLEIDLKDKRKNKNRIKEYPFLSESQLQRIYRREICFSHLSKGQRIKIQAKGIILDPEED